MTGQILIMSFAMKNLRLHWLRSLLAVIGIVIGVLAIGYMSMSNNVELMGISEEWKAYDSFIVSPNSEFAMKQGQDSIITERQVLMIRQADPDNLIIPTYGGTKDRVKIKQEYIGTSLLGINAGDLLEIAELEEGGVPRSGSEVILGSYVAQEKDLHIGSMMSISRKEDGDEEEENPVRVVGILKKLGRWDISVDFATIPYEPWLRNRVDFKGYESVLVKLSNVSQMNESIEAVRKDLNARDPEVNIDDFNQYRTRYLTDMQQKAATTTAIAGISLVVAGVSIFNVMVMSVIERYREIGVLRSIGTRRSAIMSMFMYESLLLGITGSGIGGILALVLGYLQVSTGPGLKFFLDPTTLIMIPYAMSFGIVISLLSGLYPAWKASRLNPIEALRYE